MPIIFIKSAFISLAPIEQICLKFDVGVLYENFFLENPHVVPIGHNIGHFT
jgi:hypothetical protein